MNFYKLQDNFDYKMLIIISIELYNNIIIFHFLESETKYCYMYWYCYGREEWGYFKLYCKRNVFLIRNRNTDLVLFYKHIECFRNKKKYLKNAKLYPLRRLLLLMIYDSWVLVWYHNLIYIKTKCMETQWEFIKSAY